MVRLRALWRNIRERGRVERELDEEVRAMHELLVDEKIASGLRPAEARRAATIELGQIESIKERVRDVRAGALFTALAQDARYAVRVLARNPGFAGVAVVTLALGIGATTTVFSAVHAVLLRPLPYPSSNRLVEIWSSMPASGVPRSQSALPDYRAWRVRNRTFEEIGAYHGTSYALTGGDRPERVRGVRVSASVWTVLEVRPHLGSLFSSREESWGNHRVVVLSHRLWMRRFGGDPTVIGRSVSVNDESFTVTGVMPNGFHFPEPRVEVWTPISHPAGDAMETRSNRFVHLLGRLKAGVTVAHASADLSLLAEQTANEAPENAGVGVVVAGWHQSLVGDVRQALWLLFGAVAFVLAIACANVAGLLLARGPTRRKELSVRAALGAGRERLLRQLLTESLLLAALGALFGGVFAYVLIQTLPTLAASGVPRLGEVGLDVTVLAFTTLLVVVTAVGFGLWPAWRVGRVNAAESLSDSGRTHSADRSQSIGHTSLVIGEVALSLVLLVGAALFVMSLWRVQRVDPGFRPEQVLTMHLSLPAKRYSSPDQTVLFLDQILGTMRAQPGVSVVGATTALPLGDSEWGKYLTIEGRQPPSSLADVPTVRYRAITSQYFTALGATIQRGRPFQERENARQPRVAIVNETAARRFWPGGSPIGARVSIGPPEALVVDLLPPDFPGGIEGWRASFPWFTVVGVVGDLRTHGLEREVNPEVFIPFSQAGEETARSFYVVARTVPEPLTLAHALEAAVHRIDPTQPVSDLQPMAGLVAESLARRRFATTVLGLFAMVAAVLSFVGLYGLMSYTVNQRRREMGIRLALGAQPRDLLRLVLRQGLTMTSAGIALGLLCAAALSRLISSQLFEVRPVETSIYAMAALMLLACAGIACVIPGMRAAHTDPLSTLREG
jgi:predicted permease